MPESIVSDSTEVLVSDSAKLDRIRNAMAALTVTAEPIGENLDDSLGYEPVSKVTRITDALRVLDDNYLQLQDELKDAPPVEQVLPLTEAQQDLVVDYFSFAKNIANQMAKDLPGNITFEDLSGAAMLGLVDAATRYDPTMSTATFATFAYPRIKGAIIDDLRNLDFAPRSVRAKAKRIEALGQRLANVYHRPPTDKEVAEELEMPTAKVSQLRDEVHRGTTVSIDEQRFVDGPAQKASFVHFLRDKHAVDPGEHVDDLATQTIVRGAVAALSDRDRHVIEAYYFDERTLDDIAGDLGVTESRVCQIHTKAIKLLAALLTQRLG